MDAKNTTMIPKYIKYTVRNQRTGRIVGVYSDKRTAVSHQSQNKRDLYITVKEI